MGSEQPQGQTTISLDVMGGERGVGSHVLGALWAVQNKPDLVINLYGDEKLILKYLERHPKEYHSRLPIVHCTDKIEMDDHAGHAARKKDSSMYKAFESVKERQAQAVVSAGHSGAMMACSLFLLKRIEGMDRPAIMVKIPTVKGYAVMLDMGANVDCKPLHLVQFAVMGNAYAQSVEKIAAPRVGVLSNGTEKHKGNELVREVNSYIAQLDLNYVGYVEGHDIFQHKADVIVCDGFVGNVVLKCSEGLMESMFQFIKTEVKKSFFMKMAGLALKPVFKVIKSKTDPSEIGAAPLLGVQGNVFICHGDSNARAIENALYKAYEAAVENLSDKISVAAQKLSGLQPPSEGVGS